MEKERTHPIEVTVDTGQMSEHASEEQLIYLDNFYTTNIHALFLDFNKMEENYGQY